jgi:hypothetical protein
VEPMASLWNHDTQGLSAETRVNSCLKPRRIGRRSEYTRRVMLFAVTAEEAITADLMVRTWMQVKPRFMVVGDSISTGQFYTEAAIAHQVAT